MLWHPNATRVAATKTGSMYEGRPWRLVLHTTEGTTIEGAVAAYKAHGSWPHLTIDARRRRAAQHYPFTTGARALKRPAGTVATNTANAIQAELVGYARDTPSWDPHDVDWLGRFFAPIAVNFGITLIAPAFVGPEAGRIATATAAQRMSDRAWLAFNGVCGHQHVPNNDHWDPGRFQIDRLLAAMTPSAPAPNPPVLSPPVEVDVNYQPVHLEIPVDANGNGWVKIDVPIDRVIGIIGHSEVHPGRDGRYDGVPNSVTATPDGDGTVIVVKGQTPGWPAHAWLKVAV